ncbi:hypothetical protein KXW18_001979 [Aspergillus fumigatus]|nr:hypothetical protein KXW18_001979 [Aspergillus fumigatus]
MPIPTRSLSLRGQSKQNILLTITKSTAGRTAASKIPPEEGDGDGSADSHSSTSASTSASTSTTDRRKSLLPQRSIPSGDRDRDRDGAAPVRQQQQLETRLQRGSRILTKTPGAQKKQEEGPVENGDSYSYSYRRRHKDGNESGREGCYNAEERDVQRARIVDLSDEKGWDCVNVPEENGDAAAGAADSVGVDETAFESWHVRHRSQIVAPSSSQGQVSRRSDSESSGSTPMTTPGLAAGARPSGQFTTYQQQFSPRKVVRPAASSVASASAHGEDSLIPTSWPEIAALQTELLQLSLLHSSSLQQMAALEAESEEQLQTKYDAVAKTYRAMVGEEKKRQRLLNGQALNRWLENASEHGGRPNFAAQIQAFSQLVQEVCDLTDSLEGKYTMLVQKFEEWFRKVQAIESMRLHRQQGDANHVVFIDPLDRVWKDEVHVMIVKLEQGLRQLQSLDITDYDGPEPALADAALVRTAKGLDVMIASMVDELKVILASTVPSTSAAAVYWQRSEI